MRKKYTIKDIAEKAGVSKGTVDRVIHKRGRVSEAALKKVNEVLEAIDFKPNLIAKNLKNNKVYKIAVLLPDPKIDYYWEACVVGVQNVIKELGMFGVDIETVYFNPTDTDSFEIANAAVLDSDPNAVLLAPLFFEQATEAIQKYSERNILVATFNNDIGNTNTTSFIGQDLQQSGRVAAKLLHSICNEGELGIFHIDEKYENAVFMQEKEKGFLSYFESQKDYKNNIAVCHLNQGDFDLSFAEFLEKHSQLTGIFVTTSKTFQIAAFLEKNNLENIPLVGYDLLGENVSYLQKGTIDFLIHQNPKQQTYFGLKYLVEHFLFEKEIPKQILLPIDIINSENVVPFMRD
ncbi:MAG: substrate-binding domain-containing protein [Flavicella sp.]